MPRIRLGLVTLALSLSACVSSPAATAAPPSSPTTRVSSFGKYSGYSAPVYDGWVRSSRYVTVRDGHGWRWISSGPLAEGRWVPGEPVELVMDLYPTSNLFDAGHRIRLTLTGADRTNAWTPERNPPPRLTVYREAGRASYLEVPVVDSPHQ